MADDVMLTRNTRHMTKGSPHTTASCFNELWFFASAIPDTIV